MSTEQRKEPTYEPLEAQVEVPLEGGPLAEGEEVQYVREVDDDTCQVRIVAVRVIKKVPPQ